MGTSCLILCALVYACLLVVKEFNSHVIQVALSLVLTLLVGLLVSLGLFTPHAPDTPPWWAWFTDPLGAFMAIFALNLTLTMPHRKLALGLSCVIIGLNAFGTKFLFGGGPDTPKLPLETLLGQVSFLVAGTLAVAMNRAITDSDHRETFNGARGVIDARVKLEYEREQQVSSYSNIL